MKEFLKWLGINEKVSRVALWILIIMIYLIALNMFLDSIGLPHYKVTQENIHRLINNKQALDYVSAWLITLINFYLTMFLVFSKDKSKTIISLSFPYLIINILIATFISKALTQVYMLAFLLISAYLISGKNKKYIFYMIISMVINTIVQMITYTYKASSIKYTTISKTENLLLGIDYFIIMFMIIVVKEIYLHRKSQTKNKARVE